MVSVPVLLWRGIIIGTIFNNLGYNRMRSDRCGSKYLIASWAVWAHRCINLCGGGVHLFYIPNIGWRSLSPSEVFCCQFGFYFSGVSVVIFLHSL